MSKPTKDALKRARLVCSSVFHTTRSDYLYCSLCSLIALAIDEAVAAEREACASLAWGHFKVDPDGTATRERGWQVRAGMQIGAAIRARGESDAE